MAPPLQRLGDSHVDYQSYPLEILYTNCPQTVSKWISDHIFIDACTTIGFDTESVPRGAPWISKQVNFLGPATVQLSTMDSSLVVQLVRINGKPCLSCTPLLEEVFRNKSIIKAGCGVDEDLINLRRYRMPGLEASSRLDLIGFGDVFLNGAMGLKRLTAHILGLDLPKHKKVSASDWSQVPLTERQIVYAARDAWASSAILDRLARFDIDSFSSEALVQQLTKQSTLRDLCIKRENRRQAKANLSSMAPQTSNEAGLQPWKTATVQEL